MFIFSALAKACFFYLSYGIPNDHVGWVCARSWGFHGIKKRSLLMKATFQSYRINYLAGAKGKEDL
jgi:hypothetical protein